MFDCGLTIQEIAELRNLPDNAVLRSLEGLPC